MPGDQLRTFVERNQKKEMDGNTPSSISSATYTGFIQVFFLEGGDGRCIQRVQGRINTIATLYLVIVLCTLL